MQGVEDYIIRLHHARGNKNGRTGDNVYELEAIRPPQQCDVGSFKDRWVNELVELVWEPRINQGLVRFLDLNAGASQQDHDRRTDEMIAKINAAGEAFFSGTTWRGRRAMRVSVCNWQTTIEDVTRTVANVAQLLHCSSQRA
jgi:hypothetical protein